MGAVLERTTFETSRELEYFTEKELRMQIGYDRDWWPIALLKELVDNSLDACETGKVPPVIEVVIDSNGFGVRDNGPGLSPDTLKRSLDYQKRVSDKNFYCSPTRGQMGNALKVIWAAPFVVHEKGKVEVWGRGLHHTVDVSLDRIAQELVINHTVADDFVKNGTFVKIHWPESSSLLFESQTSKIYNPQLGGYSCIPSAMELIENYAAFNPHATFILGSVTFEATDPDWRKWWPGDPISPHWYSPETLRDLIAAYLKSENGNGRGRTIREFVSEFRGLSSTGKQKKVTVDHSGKYLRDLVKSDDINMELVSGLLDRMQAISKAPKPGALGVIGGDHFKNWMVRHASVTEESVRYSKGKGVEDDLPHIVEVASGVRKDDDDGRRIITGLNWSPTLSIPVPMLQEVLGEMRVDSHDPVTVMVHLARPRFEFVDRGKTRLQL